MVKGRKLARDDGQMKLKWGEGGAGWGGGRTKEREANEL